MVCFAVVVSRTGRGTRRGSALTVHLGQAQVQICQVDQQMARRYPEPQGHPELVIGRSSPS
jgi:hypothetical protein